MISRLSPSHLYRYRRGLCYTRLQLWPHLNQQHPVPYRNMKVPCRIAQHRSSTSPYYSKVLSFRRHTGSISYRTWEPPPANQCRSGSWRYLQLIQQSYCQTPIPTCKVRKLCVRHSTYHEFWRHLSRAKDRKYATLGLMQKVPSLWWADPFWQPL